MIASDDPIVHPAVSDSQQDSEFAASGAGGRWLDDQSTTMVSALARLVASPGYPEPSTETMPYGPAINHCLDEVLALGEELGLYSYKDPEGHYGYVELAGGSEMMGILCHLDMNGSGDAADWFSDPFSLESRNGVLYGCGVQQCKGAVVASLFAMRALREFATPLRHTIRLILALDANQQWQSCAHYLRQERVPDVSFSPTGSFPVVYAEKRLLQLSLHGPASADLYLECIGAEHRVPDRAAYQGKRQKALQKKLEAANLPWYTEDGRTVVLGQAAPADLCDCAGVNAIIRLSQVLQSVGYQHPALGFCSLVVGNDPHARALLGDVADGCSGKLTVNVSGLVINAQGSRIDLDIRIPVEVDFESFCEKLQSAVACLGWHYHEQRHLPPLHVAPDAPLISHLSDSYRALTGEARSPVATGRVSFARALPNCVSFGALFPEFPDTAHQANEHLALESLVGSSKIFACALNRLQQIPLGIALGRQY